MNALKKSKDNKEALKRKKLLNRKRIMQEK
jgi:hypothetical protein